MLIESVTNDEKHFPISAMTFSVVEFLCVRDGFAAKIENKFVNNVCGKPPKKNQTGFYYASTQKIYQQSTEHE